MTSPRGAEAGDNLWWQTFGGGHHLTTRDNLRHRCVRCGDQHTGWAIRTLKSGITIQPREISKHLIEHFEDQLPPPPQVRSIWPDQSWTDSPPALCRLTGQWLGQSFENDRPVLRRNQNQPFEWIVVQPIVGDPRTTSNFSGVFDAVVDPLQNANVVVANNFLIANMPPCPRGLFWAKIAIRPASHPDATPVYFTYYDRALYDESWALHVRVQAELLAKDFAETPQGMSATLSPDHVEPIACVSPGQLHCLLFAAFTRVLHILPASGIDMQAALAPTKSSRTVLHFASIFGSMSMAQAIPFGSVDVDLIDDLGNTALHYAALYRHAEIYRHIKEVLGASVLILNAHSQTADDLMAASTLVGTLEGKYHNYMRTAATSMALEVKNLESSSQRLTNLPEHVSPEELDALPSVPESGFDLAIALTTLSSGSVAQICSVLNKVSAEVRRGPNFDMRNLLAAVQLVLETGTAAERFAALEVFGNIALHGGSDLSRSVVDPVASILKDGSVSERIEALRLFGDFARDRYGYDFTSFVVKRWSDPVASILKDGSVSERIAALRLFGDFARDRYGYDFTSFVVKRWSDPVASILKDGSVAERIAALTLIGDLAGYAGMFSSSSSGIFIKGFLEQWCECAVGILRTSSVDETRAAMQFFAQLIESLGSDGLPLPSERYLRALQSVLDDGTPSECEAAIRLFATESVAAEGSNRKRLLEIDGWPCLNSFEFVPPLLTQDSEH